MAFTEDASGTALPTLTFLLAGLFELAFAVGLTFWSRHRERHAAQGWGGSAMGEENDARLLPWLVLLVAGGLEIVWAVGLRYTEGFTRLWPTLATLAIAWVSFFLLAFAMKSIPVGTAYAIWTGIGAAGTAMFGILLFGEPATVGRLACLALIIAGIIGLKLLSGH